MAQASKKILKLHIDLKKKLTIFLLTSSEQCGNFLQLPRIFLGCAWSGQCKYWNISNYSFLESWSHSTKMGPSADHIKLTFFAQVHSFHLPTSDQYLCPPLNMAIVSSSEFQIITTLFIIKSVASNFRFKTPSFTINLCALFLISLPWEKDFDYLRLLIILCFRLLFPSQKIVGLVLKDSWWF